MKTPKEELIEEVNIAFSKFEQSTGMAVKSVSAKYHEVQWEGESGIKYVAYGYLVETMP